MAGMETLRLVVQNFCKRSGTKQNIICKYVAGVEWSQIELLRNSVLWWFEDTLFTYIYTYHYIFI